ncbi:MAG: hydantoinase/oxoprolinase family protein [Candidatus Nezhaarchaeales archaeon]
MVNGVNSEPLYAVGLDVGGANTKACLVKVGSGRIKEVKVVSTYFPIWKRGKDELPKVLQQLKELLLQGFEAGVVGVTMTAELSDAYFCKREGVHHVLNSVKSVFPEDVISVIDCDGRLLSVDEAKADPLRVAAANWMATASMVSKLVPTCLVVDVGSTTTSIIPIAYGKPIAIGKNDLEKLACGELIYTGALRTNLAAIINRVPVKGMMVRVSSELFATTADVHLVLNHISMEDYTCDTADGRGKSRLECLARLSRVVCADIDMLDEGELLRLASFIYERQIDQIVEGVREVYERLKREAPNLEIPAVVAGIGRRFLAEEAVKRLGIRAIDLANLIGSEASKAAPSVGVAILAASSRVGEALWSSISSLR